MIIFIAMILSAGIAASVLLQTITNLQHQALRTGEETLHEISSGIRVTHVSGYSSGTLITQLGIFIQPTAASEPIDLNTTVIALSDSTNKVLLFYDSTCYNASPSGGLFGTLTIGNLNATEFGLIVIRDIDGSITQTNPVLNQEDLAVMIVNTAQCFSGGIAARAEVSGSIYAEYGFPGLIGFVTPSSLSSTIVDLQP